MQARILRNGTLRVKNAKEVGQSADFVHQYVLECTSTVLENEDKHTKVQVAHAANAQDALKDLERKLKAFNDALDLFIDQANNGDFEYPAQP